MGSEGNCLKGWGLKAMMSEFTQIFIDLSQPVQDQEKGTSDVKINIVDFTAANSLW